jgi:hypothetical protein
MLFIGMTAAAASAEPVTMKLKFPAGQVDKLAMTMDLDMTISGDALPAPKKQTVKMGLDLTLKVTNSDDKGAVVELTYDRMSLQASVEGRDLKFDSAADMASGENPLSGLAAIVGGKLTLHFDADGKLAKVDGSDELAKKAAGATNGGLAVQLLQEQLNADRIKHMFNSRFADALPTKPVDVGGTWDSNSVQNVDGLNVKLTTTNKLLTIDEKAGHKIAKIEFTGSGTIDTAAGGEPKLKVSELTAKGTNSFDLDRGFFSDSDTQQKLKGSIIRNKSTLNMDQTVNSKLTITSGAK